MKYIEEIEYNNKPVELCPYGMRTPDGYTNITLDGYYCGNMGKEDNCKYCYGNDKEKQVVYCTYKHFNPEVKMEEKYRVLKGFTKYDYIVAHQKMYGWGSFENSCEEFQEDIEKWNNGKGYEKHIKCSPGGVFSKNFWIHAVKFGFMEKIEEDFYSIGNEFERGTGDEWKLNHMGNHEVALHDIRGYIWLGVVEPKLKVSNVFKILASDFHKHFGNDFKKIKE
jgi:hypothetical protein